MSCCGGGNNNNNNNNNNEEETEDLSASFNKSLNMQDDVDAFSSRTTSPMQISSSSSSTRLLSLPEPARQEKWSTVLTTEILTMTDDDKKDNSATATSSSSLGGGLKDMVCQLVDRMQESCKNAIQGQSWNDLYVTDWEWTMQEETETDDDDEDNNNNNNNNNTSDKEEEVWPTVAESGYLSKQRVTIGWGPQAPPPSWLEDDDDEEEEDDDENLIILATLVFYHLTEEPLTEDDFVYSGDDDDDYDEYPLSRVISIVAEYQTMKTTTNHHSNSNSNSTTTTTTTAEQPTPIVSAVKFEDPAPLHTYGTILLQNTFLLWRKPVIAKGNSSNNNAILLLDPSLAGQLYVNGRRSSSSMPNALFGMDWSGEGDWKETYGALWQDVVVDSTILNLDVNRRLLYRLLYLEGDVIWDEDAPVIDLTTTTTTTSSSSSTPQQQPPESSSSSSSSSSLESIILSDPKYDFVGIAAKALATSFETEFGPTAFPIVSLEKDIEPTHRFLPKAHPLVVVPPSVFQVLKRGGFYSWLEMTTWCWKTNAEQPSPVDNEVVPAAVAEAARELSLTVQMVVVVDTKYISAPCCCLDGKTIHVNVNALLLSADDDSLVVVDWKQAMAQALSDYQTMIVGSSA